MHWFYWTTQQHAALLVISGQDPQVIAQRLNTKAAVVQFWSDTFNAAGVQKIGESEAERIRTILRGMLEWERLQEPVYALLQGATVRDVVLQYRVKEEWLKIWLARFLKAGRKCLRDIFELCLALERNENIEDEISKQYDQGLLHILREQVASKAYYERSPSFSGKLFEQAVLLAMKQDVEKAAQKFGLNTDFLASLKSIYSVEADEKVALEQRRSLQAYISAGTTALKNGPSQQIELRTVAIEILCGKDMHSLAKRDQVDEEWLARLFSTFRSAGLRSLGGNVPDKEKVVVKLLQGTKVISLNHKLTRGRHCLLKWRGPHTTREKEELSHEILSWRERYLCAASKSIGPACGRLFIISGTPTSGKTTLINMIRLEPSLNAVVVPKYATRSWRNVSDDTQYNATVSDKAFDFTYPYHNNRYGVSVQAIYDILSRGFNGFIIVSPPRIVRQMKQVLGSLATTIYLHSNRAEAELVEIVTQRRNATGVYRNILTQELDKEVRTRTINMRVVRRQYVENIALYDHVLLNTASQENLLLQLKNIVRAYQEDRYCQRARPSGGNVLFLLCAPPSSGKGTLSKALAIMGTKVITNFTKVADRAKRDNDGSEINPLGVWCNKKEMRGIIDDKMYDVTYLFNWTRYGVTSRELWKKVCSQCPQLLVTNIQAIERFRKSFGPLVVPLYLYTTRTEEQIYEYLVKTKRLPSDQANARLAKAHEVYKDFIKNIHIFCHVLLNTGNPDDLVDQMFNLLRFYKREE